MGKPVRCLNFLRRRWSLKERVRRYRLVNLGRRKSLRKLQAAASVLFLAN